MTHYVNASPAKRFFVQMLVRDIRLEDAILDLVDNAIDSLIRLQQIDLDTLVKHTDNGAIPFSGHHYVAINIRSGSVSVEDNCGGIDIDEARDHVFRFGASYKPQNAHLGVYGIGLKRAVFKIGRSIVIESKTLTSGFRVNIDVAAFEADDSNWQFPIQTIAAATTAGDCGTKIAVTDLSESATQRFGSGSFAASLTQTIGRSYSLFIERFVRVCFNDNVVRPMPIPVSNSEEISTSITRISFRGVDVTILAGLQALDGDHWRGNTAGWYIVCNGRIVVFADRSDLTGWGTVLPAFQPKHRGFIGIVLFMSRDPEGLPWTTTKRGVNAESPVFQYVKEHIVSDARPVINFLDRRYSSVPVSSENTDDLEIDDKALQNAIRPAPVNTVLGSDTQRFGASREIARRPQTTSVQFRTERTNIERARRAIGDPSMAAGRVGLHSLKYFLENEADE